MRCTQEGYAHCVTPPPEALRQALAATWSPTEVARIDAALDEARKRDAIVAFDWDNTVMRGDIGDLAMLHVLREQPIPKPAQWSEWGPLTRAAIDALEAAFGDAEALSVDAHDARSLLAEIAWREEAHGVPAFEPRMNEVLRGGYWMMASLLESYSEETRIALAEKAFREAWKADVGVHARAFGVEVEAFARPRPSMLALARWAEARGVATWIVSASEETLVRTVASSLGFAGSRVIGATPHASRALFGEAVMTFDEGKRMHLAHRAFGLPVDQARIHTPRVAIGCGDSDTDHGMLLCAELIVLVDRGQPRITKLAHERGAIRIAHDAF